MAATLRDLQLCELEILKDVKRVCEKHNIVYYLSSGTLLGAVRHQGFIPWDDDVDIEMPYPDYLRFLQVAQDELGDSFFVQNKDTEATFRSLFTKIRKNNTTMFGEFDFGMPGHHGVWIDVFPLTYIGGCFDLGIRRFCVRLSNMLTMDDVDYNRDRAWLKSKSNPIAFYSVDFLRKLPMKTRKRIRSLFEKIIFRYKKKARMAHVWQNITYIHPAEVFDGPPRMIPFEDDQFSCPPNAEEYLRNAYGDYMQLPPEEKRNGGHGKITVDLEHGWK